VKLFPQFRRRVPFLSDASHPLLVGAAGSMGEKDLAWTARISVLQRLQT